MSDNIKIAAAFLVKDDTEAPLLRRALDSIKDVVDAIYLTGTKEPQAEVKKIAEEYKAIYSFRAWDNDFSNARNYLFEQIPNSYEYIFWMDCDDILYNPQELRKLALDAHQNNQAAVFLDYWYSVDLDEKGNVSEIVIQHKRERLIKNDKTFRWIGRLHETLIEQKRDNIVKIFRKECWVIHLTDMQRAEANIDRNIAILEEAARLENHKDPRTLMYLGKTYFDKASIVPPEGKNKYYSLAKALFMEYLEGAGVPGKDYQEGSGWSGERASAWQYLSQIMTIEGDYKSAEVAILRAIQEDPLFPNYYLDLAKIYTLMQEWERADHWLNIAKNIPVPNTTLILNPRDTKIKALEVDFNIAMAKQDLNRAQGSAEKTKGIMPLLPGIDKRIEDIKALKATNQAAQSLVYLGRYLEAAKEESKIVPLMQSIPTSLLNEEFVAQMRHKFLPPRVWEKNEIAILCGPGFEKWSPKNVGWGIGGSEEAVIYLSKELTRIGYKVTVYGDPQDEAGDYEGVEYKQWYELNIKDEFNVLVLWRGIGFVDTDFKAKQTYLWLHDVPNNPDFTEARINKIDKIMVLSEYHKSLLRMFKDGQFIPLPEGKVIVSANGILPVNINKKWERNPSRCIWTSSYDRGLVYLLNMWPDIKKEVPEAELHIFYGWNLYDFVHKGNPARAKWKEQVDKMMQQDGITHHGRVGHTELGKQLAMSGIWSYPTDFSEISCISAQKAQSLGAIPVVTDYAALKETVHYGVKVPFDIGTEEGREAYKKELVGMLKNPTKQEEIRKEMMPFAQKFFLWENVAKAWDKMFQGNTKEVK